MSKIKKFGTFSGVFTPSILTILGVIMYLRFPTIIGQAGLINTIAIIFIAHIISITTSLSVASLSTDKQIKTGGTYFMISRSLGLPIGGTLGLALFVGLSFSVSLYLIGFSESFLAFFGIESSINMIRLTGTATLIVVTAITLISTSLAIKSQYFIMGAIVLSLISIFFGTHEFAPKEINWKPMADAAPFMLLFGIFFPAVTGFEAGVSMSGDLKDPKKSLPVGAMAAVGVGFVVYIGLAFFYAYTVDSEALRNDSDILFKISLVPGLVIAGIWGATLSSALGSILGAPRILQAIAMDKIVPKFFAKGSGKAKEPKNALLLAFVIAEIGILIGELDVIARIVSMFFITTYAFLNLAAAIESWSSSDYRPAFHIPKFVSVLGFLSAFIVMILLDFIALTGAVVVLGLLYFLLKRKELNLESGDAWSSFWTNLAKVSLLKLTKQKVSTRNWRPNIIMFSGSENARPHMVELGLAMSGKLGAITNFDLIEDGSLSGESQSQGLYNNIFSRQYNCDSVKEGIKTVTGVYGFSGFEPNTVLMGWSKNEQNAAFLADLLSDFRKKNLNAVFLNYNKIKGFGKKEKIDIWWNGKGNYLSISLQLVKFIVAESSWRDATIRVLIISNNSKINESLLTSTNSILDEQRIEAEVQVINNESGSRTNEMIIGLESADSDLVLLGLSQKSKAYTDSFIKKINTVSEINNSLLLISPSDEFEELNIIPSETSNSYVFENVFVTEHAYKIPEIEDKVLATRFEKLYADHMNFTGDLYNNAFLKTLSRKINVFRDFHDLVIKNIDELLENVLESGNVEKGITRSHHAFLMSCTHFFDKQLRNSCDNNKGALQSALAKYKSTTGNYIYEAPEKINVTLVLGKKAKSIVFKKTINNSMNAISYPQVYFQLESLLAREEKYFELFKAVIQEVNSLYEKVILNKTEAVKLVEASKNSLKSNCNSIEKNISEYSTQLKIELQNIATAQVERIISIIISPKKEKVSVSKSRKKDTQAYIENFENFHSAWYENVTTINNALYLDSLVLTEQKRIFEIIHKSNIRIARVVADSVLTQYNELVANITKNRYNSKLISLSSAVNKDVDIKEMFREAYYKVLEFIAKFPEELNVPEYSSSPDGDSQFASLNIEQVEPSKIFRYFMDTVFYEPYYRRLAQSQLKFNHIAADYKETNSMLNFRIKNRAILGELAIVETPEEKKFLDTVISQLHDAKVKTDDEIAKLHVEAEAMIRNAIAPLFSYSIVASNKTISTQIRKHSSKKFGNNISGLIESVKNSFSGVLEKLINNTSTGIIFAKKIIEHEVNSKTTPEEILDLLDSKRLSTKLYLKIPVFYRTLFESRCSITDDFWVPRTQEMNTIKRAHQRFVNGLNSSVLILGPHGAGKTALSRYAASKFFKKEQVFTVNSPVEGSVNIEDWRAAFSQSINQQGSLTDLYMYVPKHSVIIINDLELWWERSVNGNVVVQEIINMIHDFGSKFLVIANCNNYAFKQMNKSISVEHFFNTQVQCSPFDSRELQELVYKRHKSSGIPFVYKNKDEDNLSKLDIASFFNTYYSYTKGNPGVALNTWISNIKGVESNVFTIQKPVVDKNNCLENITKDYLVLVALFVQHKNINEQKLAKLMAIDNAKASSYIQMLTNVGIIEERFNGVYTLEKHLEPYLVKLCSKTDLI